MLVGLDGRSLRRESVRGDSVRLRRGVYVNFGAWKDLVEREKYLARIRAVELTRRSSSTFSHESAAALWGLPIIGRWPNQVHLAAEDTRSVHSKNGIVWHRDALPDEDVIEVDGMRRTTLLRTLVDIARTASFPSAVTSLDYGLALRVREPGGSRVPLVVREGLLARLDQMGPCRGRRAAMTSIRFADELSGSPGESLSRAQMHLCGFPPPVLQTPFYDREGHIGDCDFEWPDFKLLGEFDGFIKYTRNAYTKGLSIEEIVWKEKQREDRLRATGRGMTRWIWPVALNRELLSRHLLDAGLRPVSDLPRRTV